MVRDIPDEYAHNDETLLRFFQNIYGERAVFAKIIPKVETLSALSEERKVLIDKLMDCNDIYVKTKKRPYLRTGCLPFIGTKVDSINYYKDKIAALNEEITVAQHTLKENSRTAFVTFDNVLSAQQCAQVKNILFFSYSSQPSYLSSSVFASSKSINYVCKTSTSNS